MKTIFANTFDNGSLSALNHAFATVFSTNGFRYEPRMAKSDQSKHSCTIMCEHSSVHITHNREISIQNWISFEYCGMLIGKLCHWCIILNAQTYMSSLIYSESLGIRNRWDEFFDTIVTFCYHIGNKYRRRLYLKSNCQDKWTMTDLHFCQWHFFT